MSSWTSCAVGGIGTASGTGLVSFNPESSFNLGDESGEEDLEIWGLSRIPGGVEEVGVVGLTISVDLRVSWLFETIPSMFLRLAGRLCGLATPPAVGRPSSARVVTHALYLVNGKRLLTSSIVISFFSLLRRCALGIAVKSIGSPFSSFLCCRFRWLYRKQYLTPTMILPRRTHLVFAVGIDKNHIILSFRATYHRFVNTTPKPKATKNSRGELVGPPPPPPL